MMRIVSLHGHPEDPVAFDRYYREVHTPLVQRILGVRRIHFGSVVGTSDDSAVPRPDPTAGEDSNPVFCRLSRIPEPGS